MHVQVEVPAKMAGTIIGPKGQNFRRIEAKTGAMKLKLVPGPNEVLYCMTSCNADCGLHMKLNKIYRLCMMCIAVSVLHMCSTFNKKVNVLRPYVRAS